MTTQLPTTLQDFRRAFLARRREPEPFEAFLQQGLTAEQWEAIREWEIEEMAREQTDGRGRAVASIPVIDETVDVPQSHMNKRVKAKTPYWSPESREFNLGVSVEHAPAEPHGTGRKMDETSAVKIIHGDGTEDWMKLGNNETAIRDFIEAEALKEGYSFVEVIVQPGRGKLTAAERERRAVLARIVHALRAREATLSAIATVVGCSKATALRLERAAAFGSAA